jgi:hypothetical protein
MGLPLTREETAAPGALAKSATMNAVQDCVIGQKHGLVTRYLGFADLSESTFDRDAAWGPTVSPQWAFPGAAPYAYVLSGTIGHPGDMIHEVRVIAISTPTALAARLVAEWIKTVAAVGATVTGGFHGEFDSVAGPVSSPAVADTVYALTLTPAAPVLVAASELHEIRIDIPIMAGDVVVYRVEVDYHRP